MNTLLNLNVNCHVAKVVQSASGLSQRKGVSPGTADYQRNYKLKHVKGISCVTELSCVKPVTNVKNVACRGQISKVLANLAGSGCLSKSSLNPQGGLNPPISDPAKPDKVTKHYKLLCPSPQKPLPVRGITSTYGQKHNRDFSCPILITNRDLY